MLGSIESSALIYRFFGNSSSIQEEPHVSSSIHLEMASKIVEGVTATVFHYTTISYALFFNLAKTTPSDIYTTKIAHQVLSNTFLRNTIALLKAEIFDSLCCKWRETPCKMSNSRHCSRFDFASL